MLKIFLLSSLVSLMFVTCKSIVKTDQLPVSTESKVVSQSQIDQNKSTPLVKDALMKDNDDPIHLGGECIVFKDVKKVDCPNGGEKVCGCNGKTYANKCEALKHVSRYSIGSCE